MSVSMFTNALRVHSRARVLTAARAAFPATRSISSLVAFRTALPKNVSLSVSRSFTTSQVARDGYSRDESKTTISNTIFIANIPWSATEEDLGEVFSEFGKVVSVRIHMNPDGRPRGIAHVEFTTKEGAIAAIESGSQEPIHLLGRDLRLDFSAGKEAPRQQNEPSEKLYFSGCAGDESEIRAIFKDFSDSIVDIHLLKDPQTGERVPTGFVCLTCVEVATEAMENLHGTLTPDGNPLVVSYARPRRFQQFGFGDQNRRGNSGAFASGGNRQGGSSRRVAPGWN